MLDDEVSGIIWGTTGHRRVSDQNSMIVSAMMFVNYAKNRNITISQGGADGWDKLVLDNCVKNDVKFILRLPFETDFERLYEYVKSPLCVSHSWIKERYIGKQSNGAFFARNKQIIDDAKSSELPEGKFPVIGTHWDGRQNGGTYNTIEKAIKEYCIVYNFYNMQWYTIKNFNGHL
jgi:hypothetical protein